MIRIVTAGVLLAALGNAPMQCSHNPDPDLRREDDAGDALYALAQDFRAKGDEESARHTLAFLVEKYPSNRHVPAARAELGSAAPAPKADAGK
jgi:hypothetical protein